MKKVYVDLDFGNVARIVNLPSPIDSGDAVNKQYVDSLIEGLDWKEGVIAATTSNINIGFAPASIDGITLTTGDRILVKDQTDATQNGIYIFNGPGQPLTRSPDANIASELVNAVVTVLQGQSNASTVWRQTSIVSDLDTDPVIWQPFVTSAPPATETTPGILRVATQYEVNAGALDNVAVTPLKLANWPGRVRKYTTTLGDTTNTVYTVTHNLGTRDVLVNVYWNSGYFEDVIVDVRRVSVDSIEIRTAAPPGNNALRVVVWG